MNQELSNALQSFATDLIQKLQSGLDLGTACI
jgi:hypothetical protein